MHLVWPCQSQNPLMHNLSSTYQLNLMKGKREDTQHTFTRIYFLHQKSLIPTFNICFSTTQYLIKILYLPTIIKFVIVYQKVIFNAGFKDFWCTNINNNYVLFQKRLKKCTWRLKIIPTQHKFLALNMYLLPFQNK